MALPATSLAAEPKPRELLLRGLPGAHELKTAAQLQVALEFQYSERVLALGSPELDAALPRGGLLQGSVTELQVRGAGGAATSFALCACRAAQRAGSSWQQNGSQQNGSQQSGSQQSGSQQSGSVRLAGENTPWCAFIDPSASLFAPGVARLGVELGRLLVVRPDIDAVERIAIRIAEARAVSLLVIDLRGALGNLSGSSRRSDHHRGRTHHRWQSAVRRLALSVRNLATCVLLITAEEEQRSMPLPVAMRLEFSRASANHFEIRVGKERTGRVSSPRLVSWSAFEEV
jgi:recombination protein RecA